LAQHAGNVMWYPPQVAPFVAIAAPDVVPDLEAAHRLGLASQAYFVGVLPDLLPAGWRFASHSYILQLFPLPDAATDAAEAGVVLGAADRDAMRALTQVAFPDYFRERTAELGTYLGIYEGTRLAAMAGERLALPGWQEISAVCTHPAFARKGHARRLTLAVMHRQRQRDIQTFLHVSEGNGGARGLYGSMGFIERARLAHAKVERIPDM
jgi:GNAT superfamily N-acetyltransferase